jgi:hypothetical protein
LACYRVRRQRRVLGEKPQARDITQQARRSSDILADGRQGQTPVTNARALCRSRARVLAGRGGPDRAAAPQARGHYVVSVSATQPDADPTCRVRTHWHRATTHLGYAVVNPYQLNPCQTGRQAGQAEATVTAGQEPQYPWRCGLGQLPQRSGCHTPGKPIREAVWGAVVGIGLAVDPSCEHSDLNR